VRVSARATLSLRTVALGYLVLLLLVPLGLIFWRTFEHGIGVVWNSITTPAALSAFWLTLLIAAIAVPLNTIFGVGCALLLVRGKARGRSLLDALIDVPFVVSPVIIGLALVLVYGKGGWFGDWLIRHGLTIIYTPAGMVLATMFVSLPFVVREVAPVLIDRTLTVAAWGPLMALGFLVAGLARRSRLLAAVAIVAVASVAIPAAVHELVAPSTPDLALRHLASVVRQGDVIATRPGGKLPELAWSVGVRGRLTYRETPVRGLGNARGLVLGRAPATRTRSAS